MSYEILENQKQTPPGQTRYRFHAYIMGKRMRKNIVTFPSTVDQIHQDWYEKKTKWQEGRIIKGDENKVNKTNPGEIEKIHKMIKYRPPWNLCIQCDHSRGKRKNITKGKLICDAVKNVSEFEVDPNGSCDVCFSPRSTPNNSSGGENIEFLTRVDPPKDETNSDSIPGDESNKEKPESIFILKKEWCGLDAEDLKVCLLCHNCKLHLINDETTFHRDIVFSCKISSTSIGVYDSCNKFNLRDTVKITKDPHVDKKSITNLRKDIEKIIEYAGEVLLEKTMTKSRNLLINRRNKI